MPQVLWEVSRPRTAVVFTELQSAPVKPALVCDKASHAWVKAQQELGEHIPPISHSEEPPPLPGPQSKETKICQKYSFSQKVHVLPE